jgi:cytochrome c oxidase subunit 3
MKPDKQKTGVSLIKPAIGRIEGIHPLKMINYLALSSSCILYAIISFLLIKHLAFDLDGNYAFELPKFFTVSTIVLICSLYFTSRIINAYENDEIAFLKKQLSFALFSGLLFLISQSVAWMELLTNELTPEKTRIITYVFILSAIHLGYIVVGMVMSVILFYRYMLIENDPVKTLIVATNPLEKVKLEIFKVFWHFNVLSWTMIFLLFLFAF